MEHEGTTRRHGRRSSTEKLVAISLGVLAVVSPLFIDRKAHTLEELELEDEPLISISTYALLVLFVLIIVLGLSCFLDQNLSRFDPYWIYRVGGSSGGIIALLMVLTFVLKCRD